MADQVQKAADVVSEQVANSAPSGGGSVADQLTARVEEGQQWVEKIQDWLVQNGADFLVNVLIAICILIIGKIVIDAICKTLHRTLVKSSRVDSILEVFLTSIVNKILWVIVLMMVLGRFGVDIGPMIAGLGVMGFVVGFAFQDSLANLAAGVMIALNRPFKVGEVVDMAGCFGRVSAMDMMATALTTPDNKKVIVPNKAAWGAPITNFTALETRRVDLGIGISYGANISQAKQVVMDVIANSELCLAEPAPTVEVLEMADSSVNLVVRPWCKTGDYWTVFFSVNQQMKEALDNAGIQIPFPQRDVHLYGVENMPAGK